MSRTCHIRAVTGQVLSWRPGFPAAGGPEVHAREVTRTIEKTPGNEEQNAWSRDWTITAEGTAGKKRERGGKEDEAASAVFDLAFRMSPRRPTRDTRRRLVVYNATVPTFEQAFFSYAAKRGMHEV